MAISKLLVAVLLMGWLILPATDARDPAAVRPDGWRVVLFAFTRVALLLFSWTAALLAMEDRARRRHAIHPP
ncbi:hypothetical protein N1031_18170 [Herbiconiux moechotypicola]|nr:hypothetical protein [Herbiconiux moechotypicola]MCS5731686.1 hypothetical protein [Herbiconiux moechotypicola]